MPHSAPPVHSVHFYASHGALIDRLCGVVCSGLLVGNSVLLVMTPNHRNELLKCLERLEVDVRKHAREGQFSIFDAEELLSSFMVEGNPDATSFLGSVGKLLGKAKEAARGNEQGLTVFGEMVAVLWEQGNKSGALALERLWNDLLNDRAFHLHCAYPQWLLENDGDGIRGITEVHSHVLGATSMVM
jgi:hypothetical protein